MIDQAFLQEAREVLLRERQTIEEQLAKYNGQNIIARDFEKGDSFNMRMVNRQNHHSLKEKLEDIVAALGRIEDGSYGICLDCQREIPKARLLVAHWVKRCTPCQQDWERTHPRKYWS